MERYVDPGDICLATFVWGPHTESGERTALIDTTTGRDKAWSYRACTAATGKVAAHLRAKGVVTDDVIALLMPNGADFVIAFHAILAAGATVLPLNPHAPTEEWAAQLARCDATAMVAGGTAWQRLAATSSVRTLRAGLVVGDSPPEPSHGPEPASWTEVLAGAAPGGVAPSIPGGRRTAVLATSSGTDGTPKTVKLTHHNLAANLAQISTLHQLRESDVVLAVTPLRHIYGMQMAMNHALRARAAIVLAGTPFTGADFLRHVEQHQVTVGYLVPSVLAELAAADHHDRDLTSLRLVVSGGAPLAPATARECAHRLNTTVVQGFGMTEAGCVCFTPDEEPGPAGSVGIPLPSTKTRLVDPSSGKDTDTDPGELWVRGPQIAPGYHDDPEATANLLTDDGWLRTGDLATRDEHGYLTITGRLKSLIKYKGHQIAPAEIEEVLLSHPLVADAVVVGQPDPAAGELPKAYVVLREPARLQEIVNYVANRVAPHKRVRVIEEVTEIPRSDTGKVSRRTLLSSRPGSLSTAQSLNGLSVLVTGGGKGLGRTFAEELAGRGAAVMITGRDRDALSSAAETMRERGWRVESTVADTTSREQSALAVHRTIDVFGQIDVLVNNAAIPGPHGPVWKVDSDAWWRTIEINLRGCEITSRAALPAMIERRQGRLINIVSNAGRRYWPYASAYSVSKAALIKLTENLAAELRPTRVTAIAFDPGLLDIGITRAHMDRGHTGDTAGDHILDWVLRAKDSNRFTPVTQATAQLVRIATGAADELSGRYITSDDDLIELPEPRTEQPTPGLDHITRDTAAVATPHGYDVGERA